MFSTIFWCSVLFCSVAHMSIGVLFSLLIGQLLFMLDTGKVRVLFSLFMLDTTFVLLEFCSCRLTLNPGLSEFWRESILDRLIYIWCMFRLLIFRQGSGLFIYDACVRMHLHHCHLQQKCCYFQHRCAYFQVSYYFLHECAWCLWHSSSFFLQKMFNWANPNNTL